MEPFAPDVDSLFVAVGTEAFGAPRFEGTEEMEEMICDVDVYVM